MAAPEERRRDLTSVLLVGVAVAFNLATLFHQVAIAIPALNDHALHLPLVMRARAAAASGEFLLDHWVSAWVMGFPVFQQYQPLPHVFVAVLHAALGGLVEERSLFVWVDYLAISALPVSVFLGLRALGLDRRSAALAGLCAPVLSTDFLFGLDYASYVWRGLGLYTQGWGALLLLPAVGYVHAAVTRTRAFLPAVALLTALLLSHTLYFWVAAVLLVALALVPDVEAPLGVRLRRLALVLALTGVAASWFLLPMRLNADYVNRSTWEAREKYDSFGHEWVLTRWFNGDLLDFGRLPLLTLAAMVGVAVTLTVRSRTHRLVLVLLAISLALYFGRPTWGIALRLLPLSADVHFHRLVAAVHLGALAHAGIGLVAVMKALAWAARHIPRAPRWLLATAQGGVLSLLLGAAVLLPAYAERAEFLRGNRTLMLRTRDAFRARAHDIEDLMLFLHRGQAGSAGRVYAGLPRTWGGTFRIGDVPMYALLSAQGVPTLGHAYHALSHSAELQYRFDDRDATHYELFNVAWIVAPQDWKVPGFAHLAGSFGDWRVYRVNTTGYFGLVHSGDALRGAKEQLYPAATIWLRNGAPAARDHPAVYLGREGERHPEARDFADAPAHPVKGPPDSLGQVLAQRVRGETYEATVEVTRPAWLIFKMTFHPYWKSTIDGQARAATMLMPGFAGVSLPPGRHEVRFAYRPPPWKAVPVALALVALALGLAFIAHRVPAQVAAERVAAPPFSRTPSRLVPIAGVGAAALVAALPFLQGRLIEGHDQLIYPTRLAVFSHSLREGQLPPRWSGDLAQGYGEPSLQFIAPLTSYVGTALHAAGLGVLEALDVGCVLLVLVAALSMYGLATDFYGRAAGVAAAVAYVFAPYLLRDLYVRGDYSEYAALAFVPLWALVTMRAARCGGVGWVAAAASAWCLVVLSSIAATIVWVGVAAAACAVLLARPTTRPAGMRVLAVLALGFGLAAAHWLPAAWERDLVQSHRMREGWFYFQNHFIEVAQLLWSPWRYEYRDFPASGRTMSFALGPMHIACLVIAPVLAIARRKERPGPGGAALIAIAVSVVLSAIGAFFATRASLVVWDHVPLLQYLQFPWRFLMLAAPATALMCGAAVSLVGTDGRGRVMAACVAAGLVAAFGYAHARPFGFIDVSESDFRPERLRTRAAEITGAQEFLPRWVAKSPAMPASASVALVEGDARWTETARSSARLLLRVEAGTDSVLRLNVHYFPGWRVEVDGVPEPATVTEPEGLMEVRVARGVHVIDARFGRTPARAVADVLTAASIAVTLCLGAIALARARRRGRARPPTATDP